MIIGGLEKFSLIDYPGCLSAIVFTQGCNFRCHFCYNPMLVVSPFFKSSQNDIKREDDELQNTRFERASKKSYPTISEDSLFHFLNSRIGKLDGVVISGGEPTLQKDLPEFISRIKNLDFKVKLDTNGTNSAMLKDLIERKMIDYIAMDIKTALRKYEQMVNSKVDSEKIKESIGLIMQSGLPYEFRTTIIPDLHAIEDIREMALMIEGAEKWYLQKFQSETPLVNNTFLEKRSSTDAELEEMVKVARGFVKFCAFR